MVLWLLRNQGGAPFLWCILYAGMMQTDIPWAFCPILLILLYTNMLDISVSILSHISHKQEIICYHGVTAVYEETRGGPISLCLEIGYSQSKLSWEWSRRELCRYGYINELGLSILHQHRTNDERSSSCFLRKH